MSTRSTLLAMACSMAIGAGAIAQQDAPRPEGPNPAGRGTVNQPAPQISKERAAANDIAGDRGMSDSAVASELEKIRSSPEMANEKLFVLGNSMGNEFEIRFSQLAQRKSQDAQVKDLARKIEQDHVDANRRLGEVARSMDMAQPTELPQSKIQMLAIFEQLPADQFDKVYLSHLKACHAASITMFGDAEQMVQNPQLRAYVSETLPKLRQHGAHVVEVAQAKGLRGDLTVASTAGPTNDMDHRHDTAAGATNKPAPNPKGTEGDRTGIPQQPITGERRE